MIDDLRVKNDEVLIRLHWPTPFQASHRSAREAVEGKLKEIGVKKTHFQEQVEIPAQARQGENSLLPGVRNIIAVASGKGGVGKSTVSANLALSLARAGAAVGLMDADVYGPSMGLMLGAAGRPVMADEKTLIPIDAQGIRLMSMAFLSGDDTPVIWRGPMVHGLIQQFLSNVAWGELDYLVIDLPPGTGDAQLTLTQLAPLSGSVIVTTPQEVSLIDARKGLRMFQQVNVPVLGVVENMSYFVDPASGNRTDIFGHGGGKRTAGELSIPFLGEVPIDPEVARGGDEGMPIVRKNPESPAAQAIAVIAEKVAGQLAELAIKGRGSAALHLDWDDN
ncbi:MAG: Mrp/NBP35 family ATP-binding protein [Gemmatimonadetes bacterium]|nr:Mrp/NBP35 family ATP-binding protein [Gemmatimonadota bacterium]